MYLLSSKNNIEFTQLPKRIKSAIMANEQIAKRVVLNLFSLIGLFFVQFIQINSNSINR